MGSRHYQPTSCLPLIQIIKLVVIVFVCFSLWVAPASAKVIRYFDGNSTDVNVPKGIAFDLGGGGADVDEAIQWMINQARGCTDCSATVDVVVIRSSGSAGYNEPILAMNGVDSVETLVIRSRDDANSVDVADTIRQAEVVFFAGGDQCNYTRNFKHTATAEAIKSVGAKGGGIGGTSAGAMIQSEFIYNACSDAVDSEYALDDPYEDILFSYDLFNWSLMNGTIIDTHFSDRDRMGRLMTFMARQLRDGIADNVLGIGIDEGTSLVVNRNGIAQVMGEGAVYFVLADHIPEDCEPQTPLTFSDYKIWKRENGEEFDLKNLPSRGYRRASVQEGIVQRG